MKKSQNHIIWGFIFVCITGTLFHFVYAWSGENPIIGIFAPVNESVWEHMKLVFFPMLIYSAFIRLKNKNSRAFSSFSSATLLGTYLIPVIFYTYTGILGYNIALVDIASFYICVLISFINIYKGPFSNQKLYSFLVIVTLILFVVFTFNPPNIPLFISP